ncbi:MAG: tetratricopeptide repeat protein [Planctomycetota bacterium]
MRTLTLVTIAITLSACGSSSLQSRSTSHRSITTHSEEAQRLFDEGLMLCWGFNHDEAILTFEKATEADPDCAMAWWGMAYALGPNINMPLTDLDRAKRAHRAAQRAMTLAGPTSDVEKALIMAMSKRFVSEPSVERKELDMTYAMEMREVDKQFPGDPDVGVLYADSLMLLSRKWRQWPEGDDRGPYTDEIVATLEKVLAEYPRPSGRSLPPTDWPPWSPTPGISCTCPPISTSGWETIPRRSWSTNGPSLPTMPSSRPPAPRESTTITGHTTLTS